MMLTKVIGVAVSDPLLSIHVLFKSEIGSVTGGNERFAFLMHAGPYTDSPSAVLVILDLN